MQEQEKKRTKNVVLMTLEEALEIKRAAHACRETYRHALKTGILKTGETYTTEFLISIGARSPYRPEERLLAGMTEGFCRQNNKKQMTRFDVEAARTFFLNRWMQTRARASDFNKWHAMAVQCEKILEHWKEQYEL